MGRPRVHQASANGSTSASRSAAWRARKREKAGLPPVKTREQLHAETVEQRRQQLVALRAQLIRCHGQNGQRTFERLYQEEAERLGIAEA